MAHPDIDVKHGAFYQRLTKVSEALEEKGIPQAVLKALPKGHCNADVIRQVVTSCADVFEGLPVNGSDYARAAYLIRKAQFAAGFPERADAEHFGCYRAVIRIAECAPALSDEVDFYNLTVECLSGRTVGREYMLGMVSAKNIRRVIWIAGGRSFHEYEPADLSGLFMTAWFNPSAKGMQMLEQLSCTDTQKTWNRKLLDARESPCSVFNVPKCWPCLKSVRECPRGRWIRPLKVAACPVCNRKMPIIASSVCLECVYNKVYREKNHGQL